MKAKTNKWIMPIIMGTLLMIGNLSFSQGWNYVTSTGTTFILYGMSFPPGQDDIGYACGMQYTYDADGVIIKTTDGGDNWVQILPTTGAIDGLQGIWFISNTHGFAAGWNNYFIETTDGGLSWTPVTVASDVWYYTDVEFYDANNGVASAYMNTSSPGVFVTSDGGSTWTPASGISTNVFAITYADQNTLYAFNVGGTLYKSTNGGSNWNTINAPGGMLFGLDFVNANFGVIGGEEKIHATTNGGTSWTTYTTGYENFYATKAFSDGTAYVGGTDERIHITTDFGATWSLEHNGPGTSSLYRIRETNNGTLFSCGSQGKIIVKEPAFSADFSASDTTICSGGTVTFTNLSSPTATSYNWTFEGGTPATSTAQNPVVTYNSTGSFDVTLLVSDGTLNATMLKPDYISVDETPGTPGIPTGDTSVCQNSITDYTVSPVTGATSYIWEVEPASAGIMSGTGTTGTFTASGSWTGAYTIKVQAQNYCGISSFSPTIAGTVYVMPQSFMITGEGGYCEGEPGAEIGLEGSEAGVNYELFLDNVSTGLTVPGTGAAISFGYQTAEGNYTSTGFAGSCSNYMGGVVVVEMFTLPGAASTPSGPSVVCNSDVSLYTTTAAEADTIIWTLTPDNAGIMTPSGLQVEIAWSASYTGSTQLSCYAENPCGTGTPSPNLDIQVEVAPDPAISGDDQVCQGEVYDYETDEVTGNTYVWEVTGGDIVSGAGTNMISVEWGYPGAGNVSVEEAIPGGCSTTVDFPVDIVICTGVEEPAAIELSLYPNPVTDLLTITYNNHGTYKVYFQLYTLLGTEVWTAVETAGNGTLKYDMSGLHSGLYFLKIQSGDKIATSRVMKQ